MFEFFKSKGELSDFKIRLLEEDGSLSAVESMTEAKRAMEHRIIYDVIISLPNGEVVKLSMDNRGGYKLKD